jgi:hypothetical protein
VGLHALGDDGATFGVDVLFPIDRAEHELARRVVGASGGIGSVGRIDGVSGTAKAVEVGATGAAASERERTLRPSWTSSSSRPRLVARTADSTAVKNDCMSATGIAAVGTGAAGAWGNTEGVAATG